MKPSETPNMLRTHIGFFGYRNSGKSSLVNAITGQELSIVSSQKGTTTDPVRKSMELLPLGPVLIIDTPGFDDEGELGQKRIQKTHQVLRQTDIAILVVDGTHGLQTMDEDFIELCKQQKIPYLIVYNKLDLRATLSTDSQSIQVSAKKREGIELLKERIGRLKPNLSDRALVSDLVSSGDIVILVTPIDEAAPKGRLILPQQQVLRDLLDAGAIAMVTQLEQLEQTLQSLSKTPALVITDSQVFAQVSDLVPKSIPLTSFSILMARWKGYLDTAKETIFAIRHLKASDTILIAEGCTHHRQCNDIGTVKIPNWLANYTSHQVRIETCSGTDFPEDLSNYALILHCGGCMLGEREIQYRMNLAKAQGIPFTNYGIFIAYIHQILERSIEIFS